MTHAMVNVGAVCNALRGLAPLELAEDWDNVGLILGDSQQPVERIMTCLTLSSDVAEEAVERGAQLIVSHHPVLFRPVQSLTAATTEGRTLLALLAARIAVYSPHTAFDSAEQGINAQLAAVLGLQDVRPLRPAAATGAADPASAVTPQVGEAGSGSLGGGRFGRLSRPLPLDEFLQHVKHALRVDRLQFAAPDPQWRDGPMANEAAISVVAVACGSGGEFVTDAVQNGCHALVTGEAKFHACLAAREAGLALVLAGHYATERPGVERLVELLAARFPQLSIWASARECDPLQWSVG